MAKNGGKQDVCIMIQQTSKADLLVAESLYLGAQKALKYVSLTTLTVQNAALNITMRMARTQQELFLPSSAVVMSEVIKFVSCLLMVAVDEGSVAQWYTALKKTVVMQPWDTFKVAIPSLIYTLQNNLIYIGATHLDAATCQVTYQLKILTTAVFSVIMLNKRLQPFQWVALLLLFIGVALVQVAQIGSSQNAVGGHEQHPMIGFLSIVVACVLSGFAGVYFEKILKGSEISVWMRNVQLSILSIPIGLIVYSVDNSLGENKSFFHGFNMLVWLVILLQAVGGLIVAVVVKYADNILKGFATSLAIVLSCVISVYAFNFHITLKFFLGACLVIGSIFLYSRPQKQPLVLYKT